MNKQLESMLNRGRMVGYTIEEIKDITGVTKGYYKITENSVNNSQGKQCILAEFKNGKIGKSESFTEIYKPEINKLEKNDIMYFIGTLYNSNVTQYTLINSKLKSLIPIKALTVIDGNNLVVSKDTGVDDSNSFITKTFSNCGIITESGSIRVPLEYKRLESGNVLEILLGKSGLVYDSSGKSYNIKEISNAQDLRDLIYYDLHIAFHNQSTYIMQFITHGDWEDYKEAIHEAFKPCVLYKIIGREMELIITGTATAGDTGFRRPVRPIRVTTNGRLEII